MTGMQRIIQLATIINIDLLTLFKQKIAVYTENHTKHVNTIVELLIVKAAGAYIYIYTHTHTHTHTHTQIPFVFKGLNGYDPATA
jgi:hypothetical protein